MAQTHTQIESTLRGLGMRPRHRFGQNFMTDGNLVRAVADAGGIGLGDVVVEVGPGTGTLSDEILARLGPRGRLVMVEIDRDLAGLLRGRYADDARVVLIEGDCLDGKRGLHPGLSAEVAAAAAPVRLVANLPYHAASPLVVELALAGSASQTFTVQKEVASRLRAGPGDGKAYGPLGILVQSLAGVEVLRTLPPTAFWPQPGVESALVRLTRRPDAPGPARGRAFGRFLAGLFAARRKTLRKAWTQAGFDSGLLPGDVDPQARPEVLDGPTLWRLFLAIGGDVAAGDGAGDGHGPPVAADAGEAGPADGQRLPVA